MYPISHVTGVGVGAEHNMLVLFVWSSKKMFLHAFSLQYICDNGSLHLMTFRFDLKVSSFLVGKHLCERNKIDLLQNKKCNIVHVTT